MGASTVGPLGPDQQLDTDLPDLVVNTDQNCLAEESELQRTIKQIVDLTNCDRTQAEVVLYDNNNDIERAADMLLEGLTDECQADTVMDTRGVTAVDTGTPTVTFFMPAIPDEAKRSEDCEPDDVICMDVPRVQFRSRQRLSLVPETGIEGYN